MKMSPVYKLIYFDARGAGECARYILKYGNLQFEDIRHTYEEWLPLKDKAPFGQLPLLEHDGQTINQSIAICRYLAKQTNLAGKDDLENLKIDAIAETVRELTSKLAIIRHEPNEEKKTALLEEAKSKTLPYYFERFEKIIRENNGFLAVKRMTWADFYLASTKLIFEVVVGPQVFDNYSTIKDLISQVENIPEIKEWIASRPKTIF